VPTQRLFCLGLNAPAFVLSFLLELIPIPDVKLFHLGTTDFAFLGGVIVVWSLVGRMLDRCFLREKTSTLGKSTLGKLFLNFFVVALGCWLLYSSVEMLRSPGRWNNYTGNIAVGILFLTWSLVLILIPARELVNAIRGKPSPEATV